MGTVVQVNWADILRVEGILAKGYGLIPKYPMIDVDLSLTSKSIYAYLCSLSGNGESTYPSVDTIQKTLNIGRRAYTAGLEQLTKFGYVIKEKQRTAGSRFDHNLYILSSNPKKFQLMKEQEISGNASRIATRICSEGLRSLGYGMIPRTVMCDDRLSCKAKGIYAYFAAYTGAGNVAFPSIEQISRQLDINKDTYYKYMKELLTLNYISVVQIHDGKFSGNQYSLNDRPEEAAATTTPVYRTSRGESQPEQLPKNVHTENVHTENEIPIVEPPKIEQPENVHPADVTPEKEPTTNNSSSNNIPSSNSFIEQQINLSTANIKTVRWIDSLEKNELKTTLLDWFGISEESYTALHVPIPAEFQAILPLVAVLTDILAKKSPFYKVGTERISREEYIDKILNLDINDFYLLHDRMASAPTAIKNPTAYLTTSFYNAARDKDLPNTTSFAI